MSTPRPDNQKLAETFVAIINPKDPVGDRQEPFTIALGLAAGVPARPDKPALNWLIERCQALLQAK